MPEIAEVEKLRASLETCWLGKRLESVASTSSIEWIKFVQCAPHLFTEKVIGGRVQGVERIAKHIFVVMDTGYLWHIRLASTGWFRILSDAPRSVLPFHRQFLHTTEPSAYRAFLEWSDGQRWAYADARTWGKWDVLKGITSRNLPQFSTYGPDWLKEPSSAGMILQLQRTRRRIKDVLCDQHVTAGLGNYLACEICFMAGIHPHKPFNQLNLNELTALVPAVLSVVGEAVREETYNWWRVFKRRGQSCLRCRVHEIEYDKDRGGQRGSYYCPHCQPRDFVEKKPPLTEAQVT